MKRFDVIDQISLAGAREKPNEDRLGAGGAHGWVIDGATSLGPPVVAAPSDAAWFAQAMNEALMRFSGEANPLQCLGSAIRQVRQRYEAEALRGPDAAWEVPCAAFMMASRVADGLMLTWLGDCRAWVRPADGRVLAHGATKASEKDEADLVRRHAAPAQDAARRYLAPDALAMLRGQRSAAISMEPPPVLLPDARCLPAMRSVVIEDPVRDVLLMTDGLATCELRYDLMATPEAVLAAADAGGLVGIAAAVRDYERNADPDGTLRPRWKRSDDATGLWLGL